MQVDIVATTAGGQGVAVVDGRRVPVPGALEGERVEIALGTDRRGRTSARVTRVVAASPGRADPACDQAARCPGCPLRHCTPEAALDLKRARVERRLAGPVTVLPAPPRDGFRARAVARALRGTDGALVLGMDAPEAPVDLTRCPAQDPAVNALLSQARRDLADWAPFDPATGEGLLRHVVVQVGDGGARVVVGVARPVDPASLAGVVPGATLLVEVIPPGRFDVLARPELVRGEATLWLAAGGDRFRATLPAWTPQSPGSLDALRAEVTGALSGAAHVVEVGCGVGTLSLPLARVCGALTGVDEVRQAVADAEANAAAAGVTNATFRVGRADHALRRLAQRGLRPDAALLHAMRRPFGDAAMGALSALGPSRVVYVAPSPRSLADDLAALSRYVVDRLALLDQMPGTAHVTVIAHLRRR